MKVFSLSGLARVVFDDVQGFTGFAELERIFTGKDMERFFATENMVLCWCTLQQSVHLLPLSNYYQFTVEPVATYQDSTDVLCMDLGRF